MGDEYDIQGLVADIEKADSAKEAPTKKEEKSSSDFWKPTIPDDKKQADYLIRFLKNPDSETNQPWVQRDAHMFPFPNGKFCYQPCPKRQDYNAGIKNGRKCPICEEKDRLYATGDPAKEQMGQKRNPKKRFYYNVLVVKDPRENGKNEGKVFIFEAGDQIQGKCTKFLADKEIPAENRCFFHPVKGTNFKLIMTKKQSTTGAQTNYEDSEFCRNPSPMVIKNKEVTLEEAKGFIENNCFKLREKLLIDTAFKSYEELKDFYENQGKFSDKKQADPFDDKTIDNQKVTARNPEAKVPAEKIAVKEVTEEELPFSVTPDDDDAKLEALLNS